MDRYDQSSWTGADIKVAEPHDLVLAARSIIAARQVLDDTMPKGFSGDPALVILLVLFLKSENGQSRTMADLAVETRGSSTTATRWCKALEQEGLVRIGPGDVALTQAGAELVTRALTATIASQANILGMPPTP